MISRRQFQRGAVGLVSAGVFSGFATAQGTTAKTVVAIDSHAHVFRRGLPLADARRYAPAYDATPDDYIGQLDANGMSHGVLVQPSFLGTDNSYMLAALRAQPDRFRGIAVVQPNIAKDDLGHLDKAGVVGIRLNLIGASNPRLDADPWPTLLKTLADLDWQVEVQAEAHRWPALLPQLLKSGGKIVADHFGKPDPKQGVDDPGFRYLLAQGKNGRLWIKLSGSYRNGEGPIGERLPFAAIQLIRENLGFGRLVWGSDWPHTQFEEATNYRKVRAELDAWLPDPADRKTVLHDSPAQLFRFA